MASLKSMLNLLLYYKVRYAPHATRHTRAKKFVLKNSMGVSGGGDDMLHFTRFVLVCVGKILGIKITPNPFGLRVIYFLFIP